MNIIISLLKSLPWKAAFKAAAKILIPAAIGAGGAIIAGCGSLAPVDKENRIGVYAFGIPGVAVVTHTTQYADNKGNDDNKSEQSNPVVITK